ncbi:hypothetical protein M5689_003186 [Euphorbia peplus]|nr:hypothetical protein M5689_003186 [Euphorbia peplus]
MWRQRSRAIWLCDGDKKPNIFMGKQTVNGGRTKLSSFKILTASGVQLKGRLTTLLSLSILSCSLQLILSVQSQFCNPSTPD